MYAADPNMQFCTREPVVKTFVPPLPEPDESHSDGGEEREEAQTPVCLKLTNILPGLGAPHEGNMGTEQQPGPDSPGRLA